MTNEMIVPIETYLRSGIHIGTKFKTKHMNTFIYKSRPDGLFVLNLQKIDERLKLATGFLSNFSPEEILVVSRRENGWKPVRMFAKLTGIKVFAGRYPPGVLTNMELKSFIEPKLIIITDAWPDRNTLKDSLNAGIPVMALCDTNNQTNGIDLVVPCNNKGKKALGLIFWIFANEYLKKRGVNKEDIKETPDDFTEQ